MFRKSLAFTIATCLTVGVITQVGQAQEPKTLEERVAILENRVEELIKKIEEQNQQLDQLLGSVQERFASVSDRARIGAAQAELATIKNGLGMFQAESDVSAYPTSDSINSYGDIRRLLSPYIRLRAEGQMSFLFSSYTSAMPDTFVLKAIAKDRNRTIITVTPTVILP